MNYSDFPDIQQDDWSLTRPTFSTPKGGTLTVVGWEGKKYNNKAYVVGCNKCDGFYKVTKSNLARGRIPCRCSKNYRPDEAGCLHIMEEEGYLNPRYLGGKLFTRECTRCGKEVKGFRFSERNNRGCIDCENLRRKAFKGESKDDETFIERSLPYLKSAGIQFYDLKVYRSDKYVKLAYKCYRCDEVVKGHEYSTQVGNIERGGIPCGCGSKTPLTDAWLEHRAKEACNSKGIIFSRLLPVERRRRYVEVSCLIHGARRVGMANLLSPYGNSGCPGCAGRNQRQGYVNVVYDKSTPVALKFGISKNSSKRVAGQNSANLFQMEQSAVYEFKTVKACKDAEKACKEEIKCGVLSARELKDGHTETVSLLDLEKVIAIYERFGGIKVLTP